MLTTTVTLPPTTSTTTSTTTTTTFPPTRCGNFKIAEPTTLPDQTTCTAAATAAGTQTLCRGWETVGPLFQGAADLASVPPGAAQLYEWRSGDTTCFYLYRFKPGAPRVTTLNGVHCYNTKSCDVCAWDYKGRRPTLWRQLVPPPDPPLPPPAPKFEDCSDCHASGPVTPRKPFHTGVSPATEPINAVCADKGGPNWVNAPGTWAQPANARKVTAVGKCTDCHATFVTAKLFCKAIMLPTFTPGGAMKSSDFKDRATCEAFAKAMGCGDPVADLPVLCAGLK